MANAQEPFWAPVQGNLVCSVYLLISLWKTLMFIWWYTHTHPTSIHKTTSFLKYLPVYEGKSHYLRLHNYYRSQHNTRMNHFTCSGVCFWSYPECMFRVVISFFDDSVTNPSGLTVRQKHVSRFLGYWSGAIHSNYSVGCVVLRRR